MTRIEALPVLLLLLLVAVVPASAGEAAQSSSRPVSASLPETGQEPWAQAGGNELVQKHCTGCHSEGRIMSSLQVMHATQRESYEQQVKSIIMRKIRLTGGNITRQDGKKILDYLLAVWNRQQSGVTVSSPLGPATLPAFPRQDAVRPAGRPS